MPGIWVGELMPLTARRMEKICVLRGCSTGDNAHSTSGYAMCTGTAHVPLGVEGLPRRAPNDWPCLGAVVKHLSPSAGGLPAAITLPEVAANDGNKTWPGQDGGFLGRGADPWILAGDPSQPNFEVQDLSPAPGVDNLRRLERLSLLGQLDRRLAAVERTSAAGRFAVWQQQAFDLIASPDARRAFDLDQETAATRDRYGRTKFGQCVLLARRLIEAGVGLVQLNWPRVEGALNNGHWDTHSKNAEALRTVLMPRMDQAYSALLDDLTDRGLLDETLVVWLGEFGRTPKINTNGGRDHWGPVFSVALAGGGVRGGRVYGSSDRLGAEPKSGRVKPADLAATIYHLLGFDPATEIRHTSGRPAADQPRRSHPADLVTGPGRARALRRYRSHPSKYFPRQGASERSAPGFPPGGTIPGLEASKRVWGRSHFLGRLPDVCFQVAPSRRAAGHNLADA